MARRMHGQLAATGRLHRLRALQRPRRGHGMAGADTLLERAHGRLAAAGRLHRLHTLQLRQRRRGVAGLAMLVVPGEWMDGPGNH